MTLRGACRHCGGLDCASHCPETADGHHMIEPASVRPGDGLASPTAASGSATVSVECAACGTCGDAELVPSSVVWDGP